MFMMALLESLGFGLDEVEEIVAGGVTLDSESWEHGLLVLRALEVG